MSIKLLKGDSAVTKLDQKPLGSQQQLKRSLKHGIQIRMYAMAVMTFLLNDKYQ